MNPFARILGALTLRQQITIAVVAVAVIAGIVSLAKWNKERNFRPLFTHLAPEDAGLVVTRLKESGVEYRLSESGTSVLAPEDRVPELRLQLAAAGLPKSGRMGFELFDRTNLGATDFAEQINYHRALEGELERSVMALGEVELARVHVTFSKESIYTESRQPAKASVMVKLRTGAKLSPQNVVAICHLAASAVEGLLPEAVSVLDMNGNLLNRPRRAGLDGNDVSDAALEYRQRVERDLLAKINTTLEPLLGTEKYRTGVTVECDFSSGEQSEETFDPTKSVMVTSQRTDDGTTGTIAAGVPGTASNLPRPAARPASGTAGANRRTENIAYQSSRLVKHVKLPQGAIKRVAVSVLLDQAVRFDKGKRVIEPPSAEKLKVVKDVVAGIAGIVAERGDQIIVETFPFDSTLNFEAPSAAAPPPLSGGPAWAPPWLQQLLKDRNFGIYAGVASGVLLLLLGATTVLALRAGGKQARVEVRTAVTGAVAQPALEPPPDIEKELEAKLAEQAAIKEQQTRDVLSSLKLPPVTTKKTEVLVKHIGTETKKDSQVMAQVIRSWLNNADG